MRIWRVLWFLLVLIPGLADRARGCSCDGALFFDGLVEHSRIVILARVKGQGRQTLSTSSQPEVAFLDLEVVSVIKGSPVRPEIRVWDAYAGTGCGGGFEALVPGTLAGFVLAENKEPDSLPDLWRMTGLSPGAEDYLIGTCSEYWKVFRSERQARRLMGSRRSL
jgi:hypothetical protein